jgi:O-methyltransferase
MNPAGFPRAAARAAGKLASGMGWKHGVNRALGTLTGYRLVRASGRSAPPKRGVGPSSTTDAARPSPVALQTAPRTKREQKLPADMDEQAKDIIRAVRPFTMTSADKLYALILATRYVAKHSIPGDIVECGVWRGGSMQAAARTLLACGDTSRDLYLFDTYEGMPPPSDADVRLADGSSAEMLLASMPRESKVWAVATLDDVREAFASVPYPEERVHFVQGLVEETVPREAPDQISILRLDTDWYESTRHELDHLYPRLSPGGVLLIDDYGYWQGSRQAVDEFIEKTGARLLLQRMSSGRVAVKP